MKLLIASDLHGSAHNCRLLLDAFHREAADRLRGIRCGFKDTSCPDQLARNLERVISER